MTVTSFVDLVSKWTEAQGQAFLTDTGDIVDLINRESKRFAQETLCLYSDSITFTLTVGTAVATFTQGTEVEFVYARDISTDANSVRDFADEAKAARAAETARCAAGDATSTAIRTRLQAGGG